MADFFLSTNEMLDFYRTPAITDPAKQAEYQYQTAPSYVGLSNGNDYHKLSFEIASEVIDFAKTYVLDQAIDRIFEATTAGAAGLADFFLPSDGPFSFSAVPTPAIKDSKPAKKSSEAKKAKKAAEPIASKHGLEHKSKVVLPLIGGRPAWGETAKRRKTTDAGAFIATHDSSLVLEQVTLPFRTNHRRKRSFDEL